MKNFEIKYNYTILHFDEYPILFIGENYKSKIIVGSFLFENEENNTLKYLHTLISRNNATKFLSRKISYLNLLKTASNINIVTKDYNDTVLSIEQVAFAALDKSWLPLPSAFCPIVDNTIIRKFSKLNGNTAMISKIAQVS